MATAAESRMFCTTHTIIGLQSHLRYKADRSRWPLGRSKERCLRSFSGCEHKPQAHEQPCSEIQNSQKMPRHPGLKEVPCPRLETSSLLASVTPVLGRTFHRWPQSRCSLLAAEFGVYGCVSSMKLTHWPSPKLQSSKWELGRPDLFPRDKTRRIPEDKACDSGPHKCVTTNVGGPLPLSPSVPPATV